MDCHGKIARLLRGKAKGDGGQPNSTTGQGSKSMEPWKTMPSQ
jgi:hypothetical protein